MRKYWFNDWLINPKKNIYRSIDLLIEEKKCLLIVWLIKRNIHSLIDYPEKTLRKYRLINFKGISTRQGSFYAEIFCSCVHITSLESSFFRVLAYNYFKYSYLIRIICTHLYSFKYFNQMLIIYLRLYSSRKLLFRNNHLSSHRYMVSSNK